MSGTLLQAWLKGRDPSVPPEFLPHFQPWLDREAHMGELTEMGAEALTSALDRPGRTREAAFFLLTADALITYACEAAALEDGVQEGLEDVLASLGERFR